MNPLAVDLLKDYSVEVTSRDRKSIETAMREMARGSEVFIASPPSDISDRQVSTAVTLSDAGLRPVPHVVARNIGSLAGFDRLLERLTSEARVDRVLLLAGDRDMPAGEFHSSLQLLESGLLERRGIRQIFLAAYPEGHPRVAAPELAAARIAKLAAAETRGMHVTFVTQFCFESAPIISLAREMRAQGITTPLRIGLAGAASRASLLKYAVICGVGPSLRAFKERHAAARTMLSGETPEVLVKELAAAQATRPSLGIVGVHFFTFGSLAKTVEWVRGQRKAPVPAA
jgi:methylenetetrahydrofolate reductase (NADPH)